MDRKEAAQLMRMAEHEIVDVYEHDFGPVIVTHDGQESIVVHPDKPDAAGNTGLMWFRLPHENYRGIVPVFATPTEDEDGDETAAAGTPEAATGDEGDADGSQEPDDASEAQKPARRTRRGR